MGLSINAGRKETNREAKTIAEEDIFSWDYDQLFKQNCLAALCLKTLKSMLLSFKKYK